MPTDTEVGALAAALVEANDQLIALYDLTTVTAGSLDEHAMVGEILTRANRLLDLDAIEIELTGERFSVGVLNDTDDRSALATVRATNAAGLEATLTAARTSSPLLTGDRKLLTAVLHTALGAIHTCRMHADAVRQAIVSRDHQTAAELAQRALPSHRPEIPGVDLHAHSVPARAAGGDLFAFAEVDGIVHLAVGDVSGKGLPAAMMMTTVINAANAAFRQRDAQGPAEMLRAISEWTYDAFSDAGLFVTLFVASYEPTTGRLCVANAGHSPVRIVRPGGAEPLEAHVPPIGVLPIDLVDESEFHLDVGDQLVIASDGLIEQEAPGGEWFGEDRLDRLLLSDMHSTSGELRLSVFEAVEAFADGREPNDDRTILILRRTEQP